MTKISKQATVAYSAAQMYALVNDIETYPIFLPWCTATKILQHNGDKLLASVSVSVGKIKQDFTTENIMNVNNSICMQLVEGPFKELSGHWQFHDSSNGGSRVCLDMSFEFKNKLLKYTFGTAFKKVTDSMVNAFIERAHTVYGEN